MLGHHCGAAIVEGLLFSKTVAQGGLKPDNSYHKVVGWVGTLKGIDRKGYLLSKVSKKWHRHYFALKANVLYEFEDEAVQTVSSCVLLAVCPHSWQCSGGGT